MSINNQELVSWSSCEEIAPGIMVYHDVLQEELDIINRLETTQKYWKECQKNILFASFTIKWIKENKNPRFEKWLIKMLKIFILGILPDIEKRKKGKELQELIYSHFYDVYNYKDVYQDFIV